MSKLKKFTMINCGIYPFDILFTIGTTSEEVVKYIEKKYGKLEQDEKEALNFDKYVKGRAVVLSGNRLFMWIREKNSDIIAHETYHIVNFLYRMIKVKHDIKNDEPTAYLIEHITRQIYKFIK